MASLSSASSSASASLSPLITATGEYTQRTIATLWKSLCLVCLVSDGARIVQSPPGEWAAPTAPTCVLNRPHRRRRPAGDGFEATAERSVSRRPRSLRAHISEQTLCQQVKLYLDHLHRLTRETARLAAARERAARAPGTYILYSTSTYPIPVYPVSQNRPNHGCGVCTTARSESSVR